MKSYILKMVLGGLLFGSGSAAAVTPLSELQKLGFHLQGKIDKFGVDTILGRCPFLPEMDECMAINQKAQRRGLIDQAGYNYLKQQGFYLLITLNLQTEQPEIAGLCPCG